MAFTGTARFQVLGKLGEGGMGDVYEVYDSERSMRMALKYLRRVDAMGLYRFKREFRALSNLSHPNIVSLYELIADDSAWFFTMELVEGEDFLTFVRGGRALADTREDSDTASLGAVTEVRSPRGSDSASTADDAELHTMSIAAPAGQVASLSEGPAMPRPPRVIRTLPEVVDLDRLRAALGQLAGALHALHEANLVHRDLKPSNVRVTPDGRVVLMDFGVVAETRQTRDLEHRGSTVGTPAFMAPEQVYRRGRPTPAADWYAFGVLMYLALTEHLPFEGPVLQVLETKREHDPLPLGRFVDDIPPELERLCLALLERDPVRRPRGADVLARLGLTQAARPPIAEPTLDLRRRPFVGRVDELERLRQSYEQTSAKGTRVVVVEGRPGMGKSSLIERFLAELRGIGLRHPAAAGNALPQSGSYAVRPIILAGRCHERETVPYKAFDGVIDSLVAVLVELSEYHRQQLLPDDIEPVARLFPVFQRLASEASGRDSSASSGPMALRQSAFERLRGLFEGLAKERPVVVYIEDLQWADVESLDLLLALLAEPPPAGLMVLVSQRADARDTMPAAVVERYEQLVERDLFERVELLPLADSEQRELLQRLVRRRVASESLHESLLREASGNPMLLVELARHIEEAPQERIGDGGVTLDDILWRRIQRLPAPVQRLMEVVAVAGVPVPLRVLGEAAGLSMIDTERAAALLRLGQLVSSSPVGNEPWLGVYHDKLRESIGARMAAERTRDVHGRLALSLERWGQAPAGVLAMHWQGAGAYLRAAACLVEAARSAADKLAFDRSAALFREALALLSEVEREAERDADGSEREADVAVDDPGAGDAAGAALAADVARGESPADVVDEADKAVEIAKLRCAAWLGLASGMRLIDRNDEALALLDQVEPVARRHDLVDELATMFSLRGNLLFPRGDLEGCQAAHTQAREFARRAGSPEREARALSGLGDAFYMRGHMISAYEHFRACIGLCREHGLVDIEVANLAMQGMTRYYQNDLGAGLRDSTDAVTAASWLNQKRAELVARNGCAGWILTELGRLEEAKREFTIALGLARKIGARRFEPNSLTWLAKIAGLEGRASEAEELARESVAVCRETGFAFVGPMALGALAQVTTDDGERAETIAEGEEWLASGGASHNHLYFYRDAIEALLATGAHDHVERMAVALETYTQDQPLPWSRFFVDRARALAHHQRDPSANDRLRALRREARMIGFAVAARRLDEALGESPPGL